MTIGRINFTSLEALCHIGRLGTFTEAAEFLHTTQPAISARMRELEASIGTPLFRKAGNRLVLTPTAVALTSALRPLLNEVSRVVEQATEPAQLRARIRVGLSSMYMSWFHLLLTSIHTQLPLVTFDLQIGRAESLVSGLMTGELDLALLAGSFTAPGFRSVAVGKVQLEWMISDQMQHAKGASDAEKLLAHSVWCVSKPSHSHVATLRSLSDHCVEPAVSTVSSMSGVIEIVRSRAGIGMLPSDLLGDARSGLERMSQSLVALPLTVLLAVPENADPVVQRVVEHALRLDLQKLS